jgi:hypothetical protein
VKAPNSNLLKNKIFLMEPVNQNIAKNIFCYKIFISIQQLSFFSYFKKTNGNSKQKKLR